MEIGFPFMGDRLSLCRYSWAKRLTVYSFIFSFLWVSFPRYSYSFVPAIAAVAARAVIPKVVGRVLVRRFAANDAIYQQQIQTNASQIAANALATSNLQTTVGQNTASIQSQQQSINGINLQYTVKLDSNGYVSGFGQMNDGSTSNFIIRADKFAIAPPSANGNTPKYAFVYQSTSTTLPNGTVVPAGLYLDQAVIGQISASKINATSLSAITATLGTLITYKDPAYPNKARMVLTGSLLEVYDDNNVRRVRLGLW